MAIALRAAEPVTTVVHNAACGDFGERGVHLQMSDLARDRAGGVGYDHRIIASTGQLDIGQNQAAVRRIEESSVIEAPLVSERGGVCSRYLKRHVRPEADGKISWLPGNRWLSKSIGNG